MTPLGIGVIAAAAWALAALSLQFRRMRAFGPRAYFAVPAADARRGVFYAFGPGMSPAAKESARDHPLVYAAGMAYHSGIFAAFASLALALLGAPGGSSPDAALPGAGESRLALDASLRTAGSVLGILGVLGGVAGSGLLARRIATRNLRRLSRPDDYLSNLLATLFAALGGLGAFAPSLRPVFLAAAIALLFYLPLGKIRHCLFFFSTRYHLGVLFGRRGTFPPVHGV